MEQDRGKNADRKFEVAYSICLIFFLTESIWGVFQLISSDFIYACGSFTNPGPFSCFLAILLPVIIRLYQLSEHYIIKLLCVIALLSASLLIPFLLSRTALVAAVVGIYGSKFINSRIIAQSKLKKKVAIVSGIVVLIVILITFLLLIKTNSSNGRFLIWKIALKYIDADIFMVGVGWDKVATTYAEMQESYFSFGDGSPYEEYLADTPNYLFNEYLQLLIGFGIWGLIFSIAIIGFLIIQCKKYRILGFGGTLIGLSIVMFFSYPLHCWEFWSVPIIFGFNIIFLHISNLKRIMVFAMTIVCAYCAYYNYELPRKVNLSFNIALSLYKDEKFILSTQVLKEFVEHRSPDIIVLYLLAQNYYKQGDIEMAKSYYLKSANRVPNKMYPHFRLLKLYIEKKDYISAKKEAETIIAWKPKIKSPAIDEMKAFAEEFIDSIRPAQ